MVSLEFFI